ncbi:MAG: extracellular solute-binding protein [Firmicutes bacterium]|nr:extracellular solute-binding protein [Bacillota bacterium]
MKRRSIGILLLIALFVTVFALSGYAQPINLRIAWWGNQTRHDATIEVIKMFEKKNPGIKLSPEYTSFGGYWDRMAAQAAGSNLADIMQQDYKYITQYVDSGLLIALDRYVGNGLNFADVDDSFLAPGRVYGQLYGINLGANTYAFAFDADLFERAGIKAPTPDWTWEDYFNTMRQLKAKLGIYGDHELTLCTNNVSGLEHYVRQHGQTFYNADGTALGFDEKLFAEFYGWDLQLTNEGVCAPPEVRLEVTSIENNPMVMKKAAMASIWSNQVVAYERAANRPLKMALWPKMKGQKQEGTYLKPSMFFSITRDCRDIDASLKFIDFFINDVEAYKYLSVDRGVPISSKVRAALSAEAKGAEKEMFAIVDLAAKHSSPIDPPPPAAFKQVIDTLNDVHFKILYKVITPEQGAKEFFQRANKILADAAK